MSLCGDRSGQNKTTLMALSNTEWLTKCQTEWVKWKKVAVGPYHQAAERPSRCSGSGCIRLLEVFELFFDLTVHQRCVHANYHRMSSRAVVVVDFCLWITGCVLPSQILWKTLQARLALTSFSWQRWNYLIFSNKTGCLFYLWKTDLITDQVAVTSPVL